MLPGSILCGKVDGSTLCRKLETFYLNVNKKSYITPQSDKIVDKQNTMLTSKQQYSLKKQTIIRTLTFFITIIHI